MAGATEPANSAVAGNPHDHVTFGRKKWVVTHLITWGDFGQARQGSGTRSTDRLARTVGLADGWGASHPSSHPCREQLAVAVLIGCMELAVLA